VTQATLKRDGTLSGADADVLAHFTTRAEPEKQRVAVFHSAFNGLLQGNFGLSTSYNLRVLDMMLSKMPVSLFYGLLTFFVAYIVCVPLGIIKAIKHRTAIDNATSVLIFVGYSIPGFLLGSLLVVYLAARLGWFPTEGFTSENFDSLGFFGKVWDILHHAILPLACYMVGSFAFLTMLMKNNLMDEPGRRLRAHGDREGFQLQARSARPCTSQFLDPHRHHAGQYHDGVCRQARC